MKKKGHKSHPQKKGTSTAFCAGPLTPKKKVGVEQEKACRVISGQMPSYPLPTHLPTKHHNISGPLRVFFISGRLFLTRVGHVRMWAPISRRKNVQHRCRRPATIFLNLLSCATSARAAVAGAFHFCSKCGLGPRVKLVHRF